LVFTNSTICAKYQHDMCGVSTHRLKIGRKRHYTHHYEESKILITKWFSY
jgi:hypothetical protein